MKLSLKTFPQESKIFFYGLWDVFLQLNFYCFSFPLHSSSFRFEVQTETANFELEFVRMFVRVQGVRKIEL